MSLLAHKDVLSTLPPEAAARLVNANYTLCMYPQFLSYSSEFYVEILGWLCKCFLLHNKLFKS